jgi:hypothetical protein
MFDNQEALKSLQRADERSMIFLVIARVDEANVLKDRRKRILENTNEVVRVIATLG